MSESSEASNSCTRQVLKRVHAVRSVSFPGVLDVFGQASEKMMRTTKKRRPTLASMRQLSVAARH